MNKKWLLWGAFPVLLICGAFIALHARHDVSHRLDQERRGTYKNAELSVNKTIIVSEHVKIYPEYIELPLVDVLLAVGYSAKWIDDTSAILSNGEKQIKLDLSEIRVIDLDSDEDILPCIAGQNVYLCCKPIDKNLILDEISLRFLLFSLGIKIDVAIDAERAEILINTAPAVA